MILFCVLFGLSMDYEVFLLTRMKEAWDRTGDNAEAVARGLERSGRIVTSAALIVVVVAGSFAFADIVLIKALGLGHGDRGGPRRDDRPGAARAGHDAPARSLELVDAGAAARAGWPAGCRVRGRGGGRDPMSASIAAPGRRSPARVGLARRTAAGGPILANPAAVPTPPAAAPAPPRPPPTRCRSSSRATTAPHDRLTEWWYYTGHLRDRATGARYGFEFVIFRAERGAFPVTWASHLAITDEASDRFPTASAARSARRSTGRRRAAGRRPASRCRSGADPTRPGDAAAGRPGRWPGADGTDHLAAALSPAEAAAAGSPGGLGLDLALDGDQAARPPGRRRLDRLRAGRRLVLLLADRDWTRPARSTVGGRTLQVDGTAWFDHQWGDFIAVGGGGWDWFAVNLADGTDLTLSLVRDGRRQRTRSSTGRWSTRTGRPSTSIAMPSRSTSTGHWTSPATGATYPAGWTITIPRPGPRRSTCGRPSPTRSSTRGRRPGSSTGRARRSSSATRDGHADGRPGLRRADRLRPGRLLGRSRRGLVRRSWAGSAVGAPGRAIPLLAPSWNSAARGRVAARPGR